MVTNKNESLRRGCRISPGKERWQACGEYGFRKTRSDCLSTAQEWTAAQPAGKRSQQILHTMNKNTVMKSNLCTAIFHKESVVCTLKCHRSSLFIGHFHFCSVFEGATVFRQRRVHSYCLGQVSKTSAGKSTPEECTIHKTGVKFF